MTRQEFKTWATKVLMLAQVAASFTPTDRDDKAVELLQHVFTEHFDELCDIIGIPKDG